MPDMKHAIKSQDFEETLLQAAEAVAENIRVGHFRRLKVKRSWESGESEIDLAKLVAEMNREDENEGEED